MTTRRLFLAKLAALAGYPLLAKADYTKPLSLPVVVWRKAPDPQEEQKRVFHALPTNIDYDRLLYCISAVETGHKDHVVGPCGARSRYQISEEVWKTRWAHHPQLRHLFTTMCKFPAMSKGTARGHIRWLEKQLGSQTSIHSLAWCWKEGLDAYLRSHSNRGAMTYGATESYRRGYRYALCVQNLYNDPTYKHT